MVTVGAVPLVITGVSLKVRVVTGLFGGDAAGRVVYEHHLEKLEADVVEAAAEGGALVANPLGKGALEIGVRSDTRPDLFAGGSERATTSG